MSSMASTSTAFPNRSTAAESATGRVPLDHTKVDGFTHREADRKAFLDILKSEDVTIYDTRKLLHFCLLQHH